jgi:drug/metabolite transporter (DMT)-like permease
MIFFITALIILFTTAGQLLLKIGANKKEGAAILNGYVVFGYALFLATVILSYFLMQEIPLKHFTVIMSINYVAVMIASKIFLMEEITKDRLIGTTLVGCGVLVFLL